MDLARLPPLLKEAVPVGLTMVVGLAYLKLDSILLGALATPEDVGLYSASYKLVEYLLLGSAVLMNPLFPVLARWHSQDPARFRWLYNRGNDVLLALVLPIPVIVAFTAEAILAVLYPPEFAPSAIALRLLCAALVCLVLVAWHSYTLLAGGRQNVALVYHLVGLVANVALNVVLIKQLGFVGAAIAALLTAVFLTACAYWAAARLVGALPDLSRLPGTLAANAAAGALVWALHQVDLPSLAAGAAAACVYPGLILAFRVTGLEELRRMFAGRATGLHAVPDTQL